MAWNNKWKKTRVEGNGSEIAKAFAAQIDTLNEIQDELEKINEEASDKVLEVEQKYNEIRRPVYSKRNEIIDSIPEFWHTAFLSHPALGELLTEEDRKVFKYLSSLDVEDSKDVKSGFSITFNFSRNPYFEDAKLTKVFSFNEEGIASISGTSIKWKEGMDICNGDAAKMKGKKRPIEEESFFNWFPETLESISEAFHDEIAEIIKEDLWPNPLKYFNNEADEDDLDGDEDDEETGSDDDGEQDEEEEDS